MQELVTIAIPAYKRRWLAEAIDSALAQDYKNIELVIVNDHSPQNLDEVVEPYLSDSRVRYFVNEKNLGKESIVHNWNRCLELARGEYFVLLCDDDLLMPNFVSTLLALAEKYPQCNVFHGRRCIKDEITGEVTEDEPWPEYESLQEFVSQYLKEKRQLTVTEYLYRTKKLSEQGYINFPVGWGSDDATLISVIGDGGIGSSHDIMVIFRKSDEHLSNPSTRCIEKFNATILFHNWLTQILQELGVRKQILGRMHYLLYCILKNASLVDRTRMLFGFRNTGWNFKERVMIFKNLI